jgi:REP element-mobilizing transposase RayT
MCGIISSTKSKTYAIYSNPDHTHIFVGLNPNISCSELMEKVKSGSSKWLNGKKYIVRNFSWQKGYGGFTYSKSQIDDVVKYIINQPEHHKKHSFRDEYLLLLEKFEIEYDPKYLFEWYE